MVNIDVSFFSCKSIIFKDAIVPSPTLRRKNIYPAKAMPFLENEKNTPQSSFLKNWFSKF
jgi:hypothetical protein